MLSVTILSYKADAGTLVVVYLSHNYEIFQWLPENPDNHVPMSWLSKNDLIAATNCSGL